jgi:hypothetical protein
MRNFRSIALVYLLLAIGSIQPAFAKGSVVSYVEPKNALNPAPAMPLNAFQRFEIQPISMDAPFAGQKSNEAAKASMQANLDLEATPVLAEWNAKPTDGAVRTLKIEPTIRHIKFISGATRFWAGGLAGGSAVLVTVKLTDASTGEVVAEPEFYQHADKIAGAWTFGATDKAMLIRVTRMIADYLRSNYSTAVGGQTSLAPGAKS